jgi:crossover junction endodeoxyribonuclease RuvC
MPPISNSQQGTVILGIDPGLADTGYGVILKKNNQLQALDFGCIKTKAGTPEQQRLSELFSSLKTLLQKHRPEVVAIEKLFFSKNIKTALSVGQARGVVLLAFGQTSAIVKEFTPPQVKQALTTYGKADKKQVAAMVQLVLKLKVPPKSDDAADALAIAICAANAQYK